MGGDFTMAFCQSLPRDTIYDFLRMERTGPLKIQIEVSLMRVVGSLLV